MMILPGACVIMFGLMYHNRKKLTDEAHPVVGRRLTDRQPIFGRRGPHRVRGHGHHFRGGPVPVLLL